MNSQKRPYRYELKYILEPSQLHYLDNILANHPSGFRELYPERIINNIYFDDLLFSSCQENLSGISNRTKLRYRWYGDLGDVQKGQLELKIKTNAVGSKSFHKLEDFKDLDELSHQVRSIVSHKHVVPSLQNQYLRKYYIDQWGCFRLTIDMDISYSIPGIDFRDMDFPDLKDHRIILELKFDKKDDIQMSRISDYFPFRLCKHSKYVNGLMGLHYNI